MNTEIIEKLQNDRFELLTQQKSLKNKLSQISTQINVIDDEIIKLAREDLIYTLNSYKFIYNVNELKKYNIKQLQYIVYELYGIDMKRNGGSFGELSIYTDSFDNNELGDSYRKYRKLLLKRIRQKFCPVKQIDNDQ